MRFFAPLRMTVLKSLSIKCTNVLPSGLEEEVTELLGRTKSARREAVDATPGYRNGYGKPRRLTLTSGTITVVQ